MKVVPPAQLAVDLVLQAEHGPGGRAWLVTWSEQYADEVETAIGDIVSLSPRRNETLETLTEGGYLCLVDRPADAVEVVVSLHRSTCSSCAITLRNWLDPIRNAGCFYRQLGASLNWRLRGRALACTAHSGHSAIQRSADCR